MFVPVPCVWGGGTLVLCVVPVCGFVVVGKLYSMYSCYLVAGLLRIPCGTEDVCGIVLTHSSEAVCASGVQCRTCSIVIVKYILVMT